MVTMKWNDTTERMMLIKFLEQNPTLKLNVNEALAKWPESIGVPTQRSLGDRFNSVKKLAKAGKVSPTLGQGSISITTPSSTSKTSKDTGNDDNVEDVFDADVDVSPLAATPNPVSNAKGSSSKKFKSKLLAPVPAVTNTPPRGIKRDRKANDEEPLMPFDDASSASDNENPTPSKMTVRRSSVARSPKTKTAAAYTTDESSHTEGGQDEEKTVSRSRNKYKTMRGTAWAARVESESGDNDDRAEDSDEPYQLINTRNGKINGKKETALWQRIVAKQDSSDADDMED